MRPGEEARDDERHIIKELNAIIESAYDGITVVDNTGTIVRVNPAFERIAGISPASLIGRNVRQMIAEGILDHSAAIDVLEQKRSVTIAQTVNTGRTILVTGNPVFDEHTGEVVRVVCTCRDLTELNYLREQLRTSQAETERYLGEVAQLRAEKLAGIEVVAESPSMRRVLELAMRAAGVDSTVLILGESGVGKDVIARTIHRTGFCKGGPFVCVNCGAIPEQLLESELFGYEEGAFTGARKKGKPGFLELAHHGTLFLDEIGDMPFTLQVKLLHFLQHKSVTRIGASKARHVEARVIAATNQDLDARVRTGQFRLDLYYRLNVITLNIAPLRERPEDIQALVIRTLQQLNQSRRQNKTLQPEVMNCFLSYDWPGNIRELENLLERLVVLSADDAIGPEWLPEHVRNNGSPARASSTHIHDQCAERDSLFDLYRKLGSTRAVAQALGCNQSTVVRRLSKRRAQTP